MFRPYRTLKIKVPRPCCPWCQSHSERIEQKLQAMEKQLQELSTRLASTLATTIATTGEVENLSAGFLTALQVFGLTSSPHPTGEDRQSDSLPLVGAFSAIAAALDQLAGAQASQFPADLVPASRNVVSPHQLTQIAAPQNRSGHPRD